MKAGLLLAFSLLATGSWSVAAARGAPRTASCRIVTAGEAPYLGLCRFLPERGGSFSIEPIGRRFFFPRIGTITVSITAPNEAEVSGLTAAGINSRWGEARRLASAPACWLGGDFRICVY
jgi:hypothetical protein